MTAHDHDRFAKIWRRLANDLAHRTANALVCGDTRTARVYAWRYREACNRSDMAWWCATSELADEFREGPPL